MPFLTLSNLLLVRQTEPLSPWLEDCGWWFSYGLVILLTGTAYSLQGIRLSILLDKFVDWLVGVA